MNILSTPWSWLAVGGIVVAIILAEFGLHRLRKQWGFKEVLKNPEYWDGASKMIAEIEEEVKESKTWNDEMVEAVTRWFIFEAETDTGYRRVLRELGGRTHNFVLKILNNPDLHGRLVKATSHEAYSSWKYPFCRACDLLGESPPHAAVAAVAPFLDDPDVEIRKHAALVIGKAGAPTIVPYLRKAFRDSDRGVCKYALMGLEFTFSRNHLPPQCAAELFPDILHMLESEKHPPSEACNVLFHLDQEKATEFFLLPTSFSPDSPIIYELLKTLSEAKRIVPREKLLGLIGALDAGELKYPREYALGEALRLLSRHQLPEDRGLLEARMNHAEDQVVRGASDALLISHGLDEFGARIWQKKQASGYDSLPDYQRYYSAICTCNGEIENGGISQYFLNSGGNHWKDALAGFAAMGSTKKHGALRDAAALFGKDGPSTDRRTRMDQLSKLCRKNDEIFDPMDKQYYDNSESIDAIVTRFVLAHPDEFR